MSMIFMADDSGHSGLFLAPRSPRVHSAPQYDIEVDPVHASRRAASAAAIRIVRADGDTARGKPPPISARFIWGLQWALFAAVAVRILVLSP